MKVGQLMNQNVITCRAEDSLATAAKLMWDHDCGVLPVVDEASQVIGMVTDRDICMAGYTQGRALDQIPVSLPMAKKVIACHAEDTIAAAEKAMRDGKIRRLPVVDDAGKLIGILTLNDIAGEAFRERGERRHEINLNEVASTPMGPPATSYPWQ